MTTAQEGWELVYEFRLSEPTVLLNVWQRMHWAEKKKHMRSLSWSVLAAVGKVPQQPLTTAWVHVERHNPKPLPDHDGLIGGLKPLLDVLTSPKANKPHSLGFIVDDSPRFLQRLTAEALPAPRGQGFTVVRIYRPGAGRLAA
jgi:hypothetical protein